MQNTIDQDLNLIERYFESTLSLAELDLVSKRLENDPVFKERLERYEQIHINVNNLLSDVSEKEEMKANWKAMLQQEKRKQEEKARQEAQSKPEAKVRSGNFRKYLLAAASVALLVLAFGIWQFGFTKNDATEMATHYWNQTDKIKPHGERSGGEADQFLGLLNEAGTAYQEQNFQKAYDLLEKIPEDYEMYHRAMILQGKSLFQEGKIREAIGKFDVVLDRRGKGGREQALWFQALAYLKLDEGKQAEENLKIIVAEKYPLARKAKEVLELI